VLVIGALLALLLPGQAKAGGPAPSATTPSLATTEA
jgi:hypothetical protein